MRFARYDIDEIEKVSEGEFLYLPLPETQLESALIAVSGSDREYRCADSCYTFSVLNDRGDEWWALKRRNKL
ncbi:MAG TPA: hypothetical protein V6C97_34160 [Oculatellaceae cyanobacterium]